MRVLHRHGRRLSAVPTALTLINYGKTGNIEPSYARCINTVPLILIFASISILGLVHISFCLCLVRMAEKAPHIHKKLWRMP